MNGIRYNTVYKMGLKQKILSTAAMLFTQRGVRAVNMDDISNHLSISKRTLYEIYENKEDLLFECVKIKYKESEQQLHDAVSDAKNVMDILVNIFWVKIEALRNTHPSFYSEMNRYPKIVEFLDKQNESRRQEQVDFIRRGVSEGFFRNDVNYDLIITLFDVSNRYVYNNYSTINCTMEQVFYNLIFVFLRGFCTTEGIRVLDEFLDSFDKMKHLRDGNHSPANPQN